MKENVSVTKELFVKAINSTEETIKMMPEKGTAMWKLCEDNGLLSKAEQTNQKMVRLLEKKMGGQVPLYLAVAVQRLRKAPVRKT